MNGDQAGQFLAMARALGHDTEALGGGEGYRTRLRLESLEQARALVQVPEEVRAQRAEVFATSQACQDETFWQRFDKAMAYVFGAGELTAADRFFCDRLFPMDIEAVSLPDKVLQPNEVWDLGTSTAPVIVNLGTLTMMPGSRIVIRNTVLRFSCQTLVRQTSAGVAGIEFPRAAAPHFDYQSGNYDIGIFGLNPDQYRWLQVATGTYAPGLNSGQVTPELVNAFAAASLPLTTNARVSVLSPDHAWRIVDASYGRTYSLVVDPGDAGQIDVFQLAMEGSAGGAGGAGGPGTDGTCTCSGSEPGNGGTTGGMGSGGALGGAGVAGPHGLPGLRADIEIGDLQGNLVIMTRGGDGAQGGRGGPGGPGGKGGKGGYGSRCAATCDDGGSGGTGGDGGQGGSGGQGGNGADAFDIFVTVPPAQKAQVTPVALASNAGLAGPGGSGGGAGAGGDAGGAAMYCHGGSQGSEGKPGSSGSAGKAGDHGGLAGRIIINGQG